MILSQFIVILALIRARMEGFRRASSFGPILAPQEGPVEHGTCITNHRTHLEGILSQKNSTGLAGVFNNTQDPTEGFRRAGTLGPLLAPNRCKLNMKLVELFMGHI